MLITYYIANGLSSVFHMLNPVFFPLLTLPGACCISPSSQNKNAFNSSNCGAYSVRNNQRSIHWICLTLPTDSWENFAQLCPRIFCNKTEVCVWNHFDATWQWLKCLKGAAYTGNQEIVLQRILKPWHPALESECVMKLCFRLPFYVLIEPLRNAIVLETLWRRRRKWITSYSL